MLEPVEVPDGVIDEVRAEREAGGKGPGGRDADAARADEASEAKAASGPLQAAECWR